MVNLIEKTMTIKGHRYEITKLEVWFYVQGIGLVDSVEQLQQLHEITFNPVAVAVNLDAKGELVMYEVLQ